jgi:hypothetical protein
MALEGHAGAPPGSTIGGPVHCITNMGDTAGPAVLRGPVQGVTNATDSWGRAHLKGPVSCSTSDSGGWGPLVAMGPLYLTTNSADTTGHVAGMTCLGPWMAVNLTSASGEVAATLAAAGNSSELAMPTEGSILGLSVSSNGTLYGGEPEVRVQVAGTTAMTLGYVTAVTTATTFIATPATYRYTAGQALKVVCNRSSTMEPQTRDLSIFVWVT